VQPLWKKIWRLLKNLNIDLPYDTAIPLLGIYPKERNTGYFRGTCTPIFIAALFTGSLMFFSDLHICFCATTMLFLLQWLYNIV
jgi:hypothetical protein